LSRTEKSFYNISIALIGQILAIIVSFFSRIVFIKILGNEYLGVSGLFTSIMSVLSLVELGVGPAIIFTLYEPLANKDENRLKSIMALYKKLYIIIGIIISVIGLIISPFLSIFIKDTLDIDNLKLIYLLFLLNTSITYFFTYKRSLIIADQREYIVNIFRYSFFLIMTIMQIVLLYLTRSFILFLLTQSLTIFIENLSINIKANSLYPFLKDKNVESIDVDTKNKILKNAGGVMISKVSGILVNSTDNLIISAYIGLIPVGLYSNYLLITSALNKILGHIFSALIPGFGNLIAEGNEERVKESFYTTMFINLWIYSFSVVSLYILLNPFISIWLGDEHLLDKNFVLMFVLVFFFDGIRKTVVSFKSAYGIYWEDRYKAIVQLTVNLIVSLLLVKKMGIVGVLIGTLSSTLLGPIWMEPLVVYKNKLRFSLKIYVKNIICFVLISIVSSLIIIYFSNLIDSHYLVKFIVKVLMCLIIPNLIIFVVYLKSDPMKHIKTILTQLFRKVSKRNHNRI